MPILYIIKRKHSYNDDDDDDDDETSQLNRIQVVLGLKVI